MLLPGQRAGVISSSTCINRKKCSLLKPFSEVSVLYFVFDFFCGFKMYASLNESIVWTFPETPKLEPFGNLMSK